MGAADERWSLDRKQKLREYVDREWMLSHSIALRARLSYLVEPGHVHVPPPAALQEPLRGILEHDLVPLLHIHLFRTNARQNGWQDQAISNREMGRNATYGLISNLLAQRRDVLWLERRLNQLRELLYCPLQVPAARNNASASAFPTSKYPTLGRR